MRNRCATPVELPIGASTWIWDSPFRAESTALLPRISQLGYDFVEIPVEDPDLIDAGSVKAALASSGLGVTVCGVFGPSRDLTSGDPGVRAAALAYVRQCLDLCVELGCSFFAGPMYSAVGKARQVSAEQRRAEWALSVEGLRQACEMAGERGLRLALEPLNRFETDLVNTAAQAARLVADIGHPAAGVLLDGFHMNIEEEDLEQAVKAVGDRLVHVQVSESHRGTPGTGTTDWAALRRGLEAVEYRGGVTLETFTPENQALAGAVCIWRRFAPSQDELARRGLAFLRRWAGGEAP